MKKILKLSLASFLAMTLFVSCTDDGTPVMVNENPYALNQESAITLLLQNIQSNANCFTIDYPITLATYSSGYVIDQTFVIANDAALIAFLQGIGDGTYAIQYPFSITNAGDVTVDITSNQTLEDTFAAQVTACDACDATNTLFKQAYDSQTGADQPSFMDTWTHEYTFSVASNGTVCSIGYQGETDTLEYTIEILAQDGSAVYTGQHVFSSTETEYIAIENPVSLVAGMQYTMRRSIPNYDNGWGVGRLKDIGLPFTSQGITIHQSRFYGGGGSTDPDLGRVPFIDFVFNPVQ